MPEPRGFIPHGEILTYEEILKICRAAVSLGITKFKVTGGEPLVRKGAGAFIKRLKELDGVEQVTLTTNGILLSRYLDELIKIGIDGINISLDAVSKEKYRELTGDICDFDVSVIDKCLDSGIKLKLNTVLLEDNRDEWLSITGIAERSPVDIRFIELMPIGFAKGTNAPDANALFETIKTKYPDVEPDGERRGNGPAQYFKSGLLKGRIGLIAANSHTFCDKCNRVRLTSTGMLKPCLSYNTAVDLKTPLREGIDQYRLAEMIRDTVYKKPRAHCFLEKDGESETAAMHSIGG